MGISANEAVMRLKYSGLPFEYQEYLERLAEILDQLHRLRLMGLYGAGIQALHEQIIYIGGLMDGNDWARMVDIRKDFNSKQACKDTMLQIRQNLNGDARA